MAKSGLKGAVIVSFAQQEYEQLPFDFIRRVFQCVIYMSGLNK